MGSMRQPVPSRPAAPAPIARHLCPCLAATIAILCVTRAASAAEGATLTVSGLPDGALALRAGSRVLARIPVGTPPLRRGTPALREVDVGGHPIVELRIPVRGRPSEDVWIADLGARPLRVIWEGLVGPQDADQESATAVEVTPERIFAYQTAAQVSRCDGEPVRLFPRAWDFASARFRAILSTPPAPASQKLTARRGDPAMPTGRPIGEFHFTAASSTPGAGIDARLLAAPNAIDDGDVGTAWAEGLGGDGRGEFVTARASSGPTAVRGLRIIPGDASTPGAFKARNRIKSLALALGPDPARRFEVEFPEDPAAAEGKTREPYWIPLPTAVDSACVTIVIRDVYRGSEAGRASGGGTTAISELQVFTAVDDAGGVDRLVADMARGADCSSRIPLLVAIGQPAVMDAAQAILGAAGVGRECLVEALSRIDATVKSGVAMDALAAALVGASANEERLIARTMHKAQETGTAPVLAVAALLGSPRAAPADRARAARLLGDLDGAEATAALLGATGAEQVELRLAVVQALGRAPAATVPAVVAAIDAARAGQGAPPERREADLTRVLPALARRSPADRPAAVAAMRRSLAGSPSFEARARAVLALGELADPAVVPDLSAVRDHSDDAVLRFLATRELGSFGGPAALLPLRAALGDPDPRVRETAAQGLGLHRDAASEAALIAAAKDEPWPFARRAQIEALSRTCGAPARDLLMRAMQRDVDEVRRAALVGLVRCHDPQVRPLLFSTLKNRHGSATLRELAAALLGERGDRTLGRELGEALRGLVNEAEDDLAIEGVAVSALRSLGRLGGADAAHVAADLAGDGRHPYRRVAIEALGEICDPDVGAKALAAVRAGADPRLAADAQNAEQRCRSRPAGAPEDRTR
jgi:HEAT repeat protein